jgi:hypothetical protein
MNQLLAGATLLILGIVLLIFHSRNTKQQKGTTSFETPYLKNGGTGFILFGLYFLIRYFVK